MNVLNLDGTLCGLDIDLSSKLHNLPQSKYIITQNILNGMKQYTIINTWKNKILYPDDDFNISLIDSNGKQVKTSMKKIVRLIYDSEYCVDDIEDSSHLLLASFCVFPSKVFLKDEPSALCAVIRATHFFFFSLNSRLPSPFVRRLFSDFAIQPPFSSALGSLIGHLMRSKNLFLTGTANLSVKFRKEKSLQNHRITDNLESFI